LNRPIIMDFFATWCAACMELDKHTWSNPKVRDYIAARFVPLKVDGTLSDDAAVQAIQAKYGVVGLPVVTIVDTKGHQLESPKVVGYLEPESFLKEIGKMP
jgi:thiol:disulfide interchange protein DsbD